MIELNPEIRRYNITDAPPNLILLDSCYFIDVLKRGQHVRDIQKENIGMTSFNIEELKFLEHKHKLAEKEREEIRHFFKKTRDFFVLEIALQPGYPSQERAYVENMDPRLLTIIRDPSDAVLIATALRVGAYVVTKDKHHLYTTGLDNFLEAYKIQVFKSIHDALGRETETI